MTRPFGFKRQQVGFKVGGIPYVEVILDDYGTGCIGAYGVRKLRTGYSGSAIRVRRSSDSSEQDIGFSGNDLDESSMLTFCSGTDCFVTTIYDQSSGATLGDLTQTTAGIQPQIVSSGSLYDQGTGHPLMSSDLDDGRVNTMWVASTYNWNLNVTEGLFLWAGYLDLAWTDTFPNTAGCAISVTESGDNLQFSSFPNGAASDFMSNSDNGNRLGCVTLAGTHGSSELSSFMWRTTDTTSTAAHSLNVKGTTQTLDYTEGGGTLDFAADTLSTGQLQLHDYRFAENIPLKGCSLEVLIYSTAPSAGDAAIIENSVHTYWGIV